jgi:hypothetical protein
MYALKGCPKALLQLRQIKPRLAAANAPSHKKARQQRRSGEPRHRVARHKAIIEAQRASSPPSLLTAVSEAA